MSQIPFQISGYYTNQTGLYINPEDNLILQSGGGCCMPLRMPCGYVKSYTEIKIESTDGPCVFSWCKLQSALRSLAANSLLTANQAGIISPALTAARIACAQANAQLSTCNL